jgi:hypothetical protein
MDSDDVAVATRFAWQYAFMKANPAVSVCGAAVILIDQNAGAADRDVQLAALPLVVTTRGFTCR